MDTLFLDFLNISITASYIILAVILIRFFFPKIPRKFICILWAIAGIRLILPFTFESVLSLIPSAETVPPDIVLSQSPAIHSGISTVNSVVNPIISQTFAPEVGASVNPLQIITGIASVVWVIGIAALLVYGIVSYFRVKKTVSDAILLKDNIWQSEKVVSPFILGIIKPKIYIPYGMDGEIRCHVIAHENAHLKRRDHWIKPLGFLLLAVYWFNPLIWIAYILLCKDIERACDEKVISQMDDENRKEYANALLECAVNRRRIAACPLAFGETGLKERVKGVMNYKKPAFWVVVLAVIACVVAAVCFLTNPKSSTEYTELGYRLKITEEIYTATTQLPDKTEKMSYKVGKGTKGELSNGTKFEITEVNLQTGELTIKFSGESIYSLVGSTVGNGLQECSHIVINENTPHTLSADSNGIYRSITFEFVKTQDLETVISQAIMQKNKGNYMMGTFACENHEIFATESADTGDYEIVTAYMWVDYAEYIKYGDSLVSIGGSACPTVLTFECIDGTYSLIEYWTAEDGTRYADSIREKYPKNIVSEVMYYNYDHKSLEKKAETFYYDNKFFYAATNLDDVDVSVVNYNLHSNEKGSESKFIRIEWCNNLDNDTVTYGNPFYIQRFNPDTLGFEPYGPEEMAFTTPALILKPGEIKEQSYNLDLFDFSYPGYYRFVTNFYTNAKVGEGQVIIDFILGDIKLDTDEEHTTQSVYIFPDYKSLFSRVGSTNEGYDIINKYAEKSIYTQYSSQTPFPVIRFDSKDELDGFIKEGRKAFYLDSDSDQDYSFLKNTEEYTEEFFEDKSVVLVNVTEPSGSIRHEVDSVTKRNGVAYVIMDRIVPEACTDDMASWFITVAVDKEFLSDCNNIVASIGSEVDEPSAVSGKSLVFSATKNSVSYVENGADILMKYAEIPMYTPYSNGDYYSVAMFETLEGFEGFYQNTQNVFSYGSELEGHSFAWRKLQYNKEFFDKNVLLLIYITEPSSDIAHEVISVSKNNNVHIEIRRNVPEICDDVMTGTLIAVTMEKGLLNDSDIVIARIAETKNIGFIPDVVKTEEGTMLYVMVSSNSTWKPRVTLKADGSFHFFISPFNSYVCKGKYRYDTNNLILETDDGLYTYVFKKDGDNLIFDADKSSEIQKYKPSADSDMILPVEDGDVFVKK